MIENKKPVIIAFVILTLIILGLAGYIVFDKFIANKETDEPTTVMIGDVEIRPEAFYQTYNALQKFDRAFNYEDSEFFGYIYKSKRLEATKFDATAALYAALRDKMVSTAEVKNIPESIAKKEFEEIFGDNLKYEPKVIEKHDNYYILYNQDYGYNYVSNDVVSGYKSGIMALNVRTAVEAGTIAVTRKVFYVEYTANEAGVITTATIYNDMNKSQQLGKVSVLKKGLNQDEILGKFSSKLSTYKFTFKENNKNSNFALYRIERVS